MEDTQPQLESTKRAFERFQKEASNYGIEYARKNLIRFMESGKKQIKAGGNRNTLVKVQHDIALIEEFLQAM